jgi:hypothetical protein
MKKNCLRQKFKRTSNTYGANHRPPIGKISLTVEHQQQLLQLSEICNSSRSCVLENIIRRVLLTMEIDPSAIIRLKTIPIAQKETKNYKFTIDRVLQDIIKELAHKHSTVRSVVLWHILTLFFQTYPLSSFSEAH